MTDVIQCQKCDKIVGYGFIGYCHSVELYCTECWDKAHK